MSSSFTEILMSVSFAVISFFFLSTTVQLSSHNYPSESNDALFNCGSTVACCAFVDRRGCNDKIPCFDGSNVVLSGRVTDEPVNVWSLLRQWMSWGLQYVLDAPLSALATTDGFKVQTENNLGLTILLIFKLHKSFPTSACQLDVL